jgi:hypothetical protein
VNIGPTLNPAEDYILTAIFLERAITNGTIVITQWLSDPSASGIIVRGMKRWYVVEYLLQLL